MMEPHWSNTDRVQSVSGLSKPLSRLNIVSEASVVRNHDAFYRFGCGSCWLMTDEASSGSWSKVPFGRSCSNCGTGR